MQIINNFITIISNLFNIFIIISNSFGIKKFNIFIEYNDYKIYWKLPQILIFGPKN